MRPVSLAESWSPAWDLGAAEVVTPHPAVAWGVGCRDTQPPAFPRHCASGEGSVDSPPSQPSGGSCGIRGSPNPSVIPPGKTNARSELLGKNNCGLAGKCSSTWGGVACVFPSQDRDVREGADMLMVKPGMPYLDLVRDVKARVSSFCVALRARGVPGGGG